MKVEHKNFMSILQVSKKVAHCCQVVDFNRQDTLPLKKTPRACQRAHMHSACNLVPSLSRRLHSGLLALGY